jgi:hypothetical protein
MRRTGQFLPGFLQGLPGAGLADAAPLFQSIDSTLLFWLGRMARRLHMKA